MLRIRLRKISSTSKKRYNYRIVVLDGSRPRDSKSLDQIGTYAPTAKTVQVKVDKEKYDRWMKKGAQPSDTVRSLVKKAVKAAA